jgi:CheY-like chemotaxis protein
VSEPEASVLVVDDDSMNRLIAGRTLERQGFRVVSATDGAEALRTIRAQSFDIVLLDIVMPNVDGYQVLRELKADPKLRHIPVVVISSLEEMESVVRCIEMGADDYLTKPFDPVLLRARITGGLARKRRDDLELEYLEQVARVVDAAAAVEAGTFDAGLLEDTASRTDALGQLARVFRHMASEVLARETRLRLEVDELRIEIDQSRAARRVAEITENEYFADLERRVHELRMWG